MEVIEVFIENLVLFLNGFSILVLVIGVGKALVDFLRSEVKLRSRFKNSSSNNFIKNILASYVLLSLEILIAADIIESIMNPTLNDILILASVVVIRTVISYFLGKEIEETKVNRDILDDL